jgi:hypothetical protein
LTGDGSIWTCGLFFTDYFSISPGMISKTPGKGASYVIAFTDGEGTPLSGASNYRLNLPANIPGSGSGAVVARHRLSPRHWGSVAASARAPSDRYWSGQRPWQDLPSPGVLARFTESRRSFV